MNLEHIDPKIIYSLIAGICLIIHFLRRIE